MAETDIISKIYVYAQQQQYNISYDFNRINTRFQCFVILNDIKYMEEGNKYYNSKKAAKEAVFKFVDSILSPEIKISKEKIEEKKFGNWKLFQEKYYGLLFQLKKVYSWFFDCQKLRHLLIGAITHHIPENKETIQEVLEFINKNTKNEITYLVDHKSLALLGDTVIKQLQTRLLVEKYMKENQNPDRGKITQIRNENESRKFMKELFLKHEFSKFVLTEKDDSYFKYQENQGEYIEALIGAIHLYGNMEIWNSDDVVLEVMNWLELTKFI